MIVFKKHKHNGIYILNTYHEEKTHSNSNNQLTFNRNRSCIKSCLHGVIFNSRVLNIIKIVFCIVYFK